MGGCCGLVKSWRDCVIGVRARDGKVEFVRVVGVEGSGGEGDGARVVSGVFRAPGKPHVLFNAKQRHAQSRDVYDVVKPSFHP